MIGGAHRQTSTLGRRGERGGGAGRRHTARSRSRTRPPRWEVRTSKCPRLDEVGVPDAATPRGAILGLARDGGRRAPASVHAWMKGGCRPPPHRAEPFSDSPATVGGAHRQVSTPGRREGAGRRHTARSRSWTCPRRWEARIGKRPSPKKGGCQPPPYRAEPFSNSPATVGGAHRQAFQDWMKGGGASCRHTIRSRSRTRPRLWEARTGGRPHLDGEGCRPPPHRTKPFTDSLTMVGGAHRQTSTPEG
jgi:hypothetical protein